MLVRSVILFRRLWSTVEVTCSNNYEALDLTSLLLLILQKLNPGIALRENPFLACIGE